MFVQSCSLGCSSGQGGSQVSCAIVNTFQNQEISVEFSQPVDLGSVNSNSFQIFDVVTGQVPAGTPTIDPLNPRRLIFRPALVFSAGGGVEFGFDPNRSYQVFIPGSDQGDTGPYIKGTGGRENRSRLLCSVTTSLGVSDPVPGSPTVATFVDVVDQANNMIVPDVPANGAVNVSLGTDITFTFNDLMDIGSLIIPSTGASPSITVAVDGDGDPATPGDQVAVAGTFSFSVDLTNLTTTLTFRPLGGLPSAGTGSPKHRIFVTLPIAIVDIAGNSISNPGLVTFEPQAIGFPPVDLTEDFNTLTNFERAESGSNTWSQTKPGALQGQMLGKGLGGGSGRLGRLVVGSGTTVMLDTSAISASGSLNFSGQPCNGETFQLDGQVYTFTSTPVAATDLLIRSSLPETVDAAVNVLSMMAFSQNVTFTAIGGNEIVITAPPGTAGNSFEIVPPGGTLFSDTTGCGGGTPVVQASSFNLVGGSDGEIFQERNLLDNFDYEADPGGTPNDILVTDGVFEFRSVRIDPGGRLILVGDNPARIYSRGEVLVSNNALIEVAGDSVSLHNGVILDGVPGGVGGPNGGSGGRGGDRDNVTNLSLINSGAVTNVGAVLDGTSGVGVGQSGTLASGVGGIGWPTMPISTPMNLGNSLGVFDNASGECVVAKIPGPGGGGAYALDGGDGVTQPPLLVDSLAGVPMPEPVDDAGLLNQPDPDGNLVANNTPGGNAGALGIEPPSATPDVRLLDPDDGNLRGGSGGGGAGGGQYGTKYFSSNFVDCAADPFFGSTFSPYASWSGASGGGGGGAMQLQSGAKLTLNGSIDATGGSGGSGIQPPGDTMSEAYLETGWSSPGGGGSGGAVLVQGPSVSLSTTTGARINVSGGAGGTGLQSSVAGVGGPGLMRVEDAVGAVNQLAIAAVTAPQTANASEDVLSVGPGFFTLANTLPGGFQGAQSCWMKPDGNFFALDFESDGANTYGWDATIVVDLGSGPQEISYRDPALNGGAFGGQSAQEFWGSLLDRDLPPSETPAPFIFRFQGAQALNVTFTKVQPSDPFGVACNVNDGEQSAQLQNLTPWVQHPDQLNAFEPPPNMIRWTVVFDQSNPDAGQIVGVSDVRIGAIPN